MVAHDVNHSTLLSVLASFLVDLWPYGFQIVSTPPPGTFFTFWYEGGGALSFYLGKETFSMRVLTAVKPELGHISIHLSPFLAKGNELTRAGIHL